jgi:REP element-mobilizing transposase RayT
MPRLARLDAPGVLHHVMARGIERRKLFLDDEDRDDFVRRLSALATSGALLICPWALIPDHFHLLVRTGGAPLSRCMRSLMSGYAGHFNRWHKHCGHLFQNRFKSIVCEDESYLLDLSRYIHLNPLRREWSGISLNWIDIAGAVTRLSWVVWNLNGRGPHAGGAEGGVEFRGSGRCYGTLVSRGVRRLLIGYARVSVTAA